MEADIAVILQGVPRDLSEELSKNFIVAYKSKDKNQFAVDLSVRYSSELTVVSDLNAAIFAFLNQVGVFSDAINSLKGVLRIGVFYDLRETVVFPFCLSLDSVKIIEHLGLAIDVSGYPCSDDSDDPSDDTSS